MKRPMFLLSVLLIISNSALGQPAPKLPIESYANLPRFSMADLSPSSERILFRMVEDDKDYLIIKNLADNKVIGGVNLGDINPSSAFFIDEDRVVLQVYQHKRLHGYRGRHNVSTAFIYHVKTNNVVQLLVPGKGIFLGQTGLGKIVGISADKQFAFMPAYTGEKHVDTPPYSLMRVPLDTQKSPRPRLWKRGNNHVTDYFVDEQGELLAVESYDNKADLHVVSSYISGEKVDIFTETTGLLTKNFVGLTPDKDALVMLRSDEHNGDSYYKMSLTDGSVSDPLFVKENKEIDRILMDSERVVYGVEYAGFKPSYAFFDKRIESLFDALQEKMPNNSFDILDHSADWEKILLRVEGESAPADYYLYTKEGFQFLASARPNIDPAYVNPVVETSFVAADGLTIPTLITHPVGHELATKKLPTIVMPHGGPQSHDKNGFDWLAQFFANRGYLVIQPQFRGSSGFGNEFIAKGYGQWGRKMQSDLDDALHAFIAKQYVDENRVCMFGWSYGGYAALTASVTAPQLYKCIIAINGVSDLEDMLRSERMDHGSDHWVVNYWNLAMRNGDANDDILKQFSPINFVDKVQAPVLIIAGDIDKVVPVSQSRDMVDELKAAKKDVTYLELEGEGHSILNSNKSRLTTLTAIETFLAKHL